MCQHIICYYILNKYYTLLIILRYSLIFLTIFNITYFNKGYQYAWIAVIIVTCMSLLLTKVEIKNDQVVY